MSEKELSSQSKDFADILGFGCFITQRQQIIIKMHESDCCGTYLKKEHQPAGKALGFLADPAFNQVLTFLDANSLLQLRACNKQLKKVISEYDGWSEILIHKFMPSEEEELRESLYNNEDSASTSTTFPGMVGLSGQLKNKGHPGWFGLMRLLAQTFGQTECASEHQDLLVSMSRGLLKDLRGRFC